MCIIVAKPKGAKVPKRKHLRNCELTNRDGIGVMYQREGDKLVTIKKDFHNASALHKWLTNHIQPEDTCVIHFRLATSGKTDFGNRHPFPITRKKEYLRKINMRCKKAVVHNGVLLQYSGHKKYSDTQKFTLMLLADPHIKECLHEEATQELIEGYIGRDKLAILDNEHGLHLIGTFIENKGCYYSNSGYTNRTHTYKSTGHTCYCEVCHKKLATRYINTDEDGWINVCWVCKEEHEAFEMYKENLDAEEKVGKEETTDIIPLRACDFCAKPKVDVSYNKLWGAYLCEECETMAKYQ